MCSLDADVNHTFKEILKENNVSRVRPLRSLFLPCYVYFMIYAHYIFSLFFTVSQPPSMPKYLLPPSAPPGNVTLSMDVWVVGRMNIQQTETRTELNRTQLTKVQYVFCNVAQHNITKRETKEDKTRRNQ